jgi:hypothetical protein
MDEEKLERAILEYLSSDDGRSETFHSLTTIYEKIARPYVEKSRYFEKVHEFEDKEHVRTLLDQMVLDSLLEARMGERDYERTYRPTEQGIYERSFEDLSLVVEPKIEPSSENHVNESALWTGLPKIGVLTDDASERLRIALKLVDQAVDLAQASNEERAQARAYVLALQSLVDAPQPPAELIWKILATVAAMASIGSLFADLIEFYK